MYVLLSPNTLIDDLRTFVHDSYPQMRVYDTQVDDDGLVIHEIPLT